jgi:hypothetical protein
MGKHSLRKREQGQADLELKLIFHALGLLTLILIEEAALRPGLDGQGASHPPFQLQAGQLIARIAA